MIEVVKVTSFMFVIMFPPILAIPYFNLLTYLHKHADIPSHCKLKHFIKVTTEDPTAKIHAVIIISYISFI